MRVRDKYNLCKTKKIMRKKIKNILINIWLNYSSSFGFNIQKMLNCSSSFFKSKFDSDL